MLCILYNSDNLQMSRSGVVSRTNKHENPVFKPFANFSCLENFRLYGITFSLKNIHTQVSLSPLITGFSLASVLRMQYTY